MLGYDDHLGIVTTIIKAWSTPEEQARRVTEYLVALIHKNEPEKEKTNEQP